MRATLVRKFASRSLELTRTNFTFIKKFISAKLTVYVANINNDLVEDLHKSFTYSTLDLSVKLYSVAVCRDT